MNGLYPKAIQPLVTKSVVTPDGSTHLVTLQGGWWECLDWLISNGKTTMDYVVSRSWQHVQESPRNVLTDVIELTICTLMSLDAKDEFHLINDNFHDPFRVWKAGSPDSCHTDKN